MAAFGIDENGELWVDVTNHADAAQSRIAELEAEVERTNDVLESQAHVIRSLTNRADTAWNDAIEACKSSILHNVESDKKDNITWVDDRPYICEETAYRKIEALHR